MGWEPDRIQPSQVTPEGFLVTVTPAQPEEVTNAPSLLQDETAVVFLSIQQDRPVLNQYLEIIEMRKPHSFMLIIGIICVNSPYRQPFVNK